MADVKPYDWVYLCSDPRRLAITLRYLKGPLPGLRRMHVCWCSHLDKPSTPLALMEIARKWAPPSINDLEVTDLGVLEGYCPPQLAPYFENDKPRWALGVKLLLPFLFDTPFLYTDDDVILASDPSPLMHNSFGTRGNFAFFKGNLRQSYIAVELFSALNVPCGGPKEAIDRYDNAILDAGVFFMKHPDDWKRILPKFAAAPYIGALEPTSHEFRRLDQRFLTVYGIKHGWTQLRRSFDRRNCYSHPTKFNVPSLHKGTTFVHYKTGTHKAAWMDALERHLNEGER